MSSRLSLLLFLALCLFFSILHTGDGSVALTPVPSFPLQFSADIKITAHLIEETSEYPPRYRKMRVHYDYINKMARADIEAGKLLCMHIVDNNFPLTYYRICSFFLLLANITSEFTLLHTLWEICICK